MVLQGIGKIWINMETVMGMGNALITHGVLDGGENVVSSATKELKDGDLFEYNDWDEDWFRIKSGITLDGEWDDVSKHRGFIIACNMVFVGVEVMAGEKGEWVDQIWETCMSEVGEIVDDETLEEGGIWDILSAGLLEFAKVGKGYGDMVTVVELYDLSLKCKSNKNARDAWEAFIVILFQ
jgi:hypothetical protein